MASINLRVQYSSLIYTTIFQKLVPKAATAYAFCVAYEVTEALCPSINLRIQYYTSMHWAVNRHEDLPNRIRVR